MKIASIVGNRPQFIKAAPTSVALRERGLEEVVIHTGQHYDRELSQVFYDELGLDEPRYRLDLRTADPHLMRPAIEERLGDERPDWVLVYGDTNSTLAGAEAATGLGIALAHVEAGLRSGDLSMPEERNRIEVDKQAQLLFCPDERSRETLAARASRAGPRSWATSWPTRRGSSSRSPAGGRPSDPIRTRCSRFIARRTRSPNGCAACSRRPARAAGASSSPCIPGHAR